MARHFVLGQEITPWCKLKVYLEVIYKYHMAISQAPQKLWKKYTQL